MADTTTTAPVGTGVLGKQTLAPKRPALRLPVMRIIIYILLMLGALVFVLPFLWMLVTSLLTPAEIARGEFVPGSRIIQLDAVTEEDWNRPLRAFLPPTSAVPFRGVALTLYYNAHPDGGAFNLYIDGQFVETIDTYSAESQQDQRYHIDSYPEVPTLSLTQSIDLTDTNHTLLIELVEGDRSNGDSIWLERAVATRADGTETVIPTEQFEMRFGTWQSLRHNPVTEKWERVVYNADANTWQFAEENRATFPVKAEEVSQRATNRSFPSYLEECCRETISNSDRLLNMPQQEFIRLERQRGSHSELTTDFLPFDLNDTLGLKHRYVVTGSLSHYVRVWNGSNFSKFFINSVIITFLTVAPQTLFAIMAAYAFASLQFPGREFIFTIFLMTLFIPFMVILIPNLLTVTWIDDWSFENIGPILDDLGTVPLADALLVAVGVWFVLVVTELLQRPVSRFPQTTDMSPSLISTGLNVGLGIGLVIIAVLLSALDISRLYLLAVTGGVITAHLTSPWLKRLGQLERLRPLMERLQAVPEQMRIAGAYALPIVWVLVWIGIIYLVLDGLVGDSNVPTSAEHSLWIDHLPALVVPFWASTFSIFLLRQFFMQIPKDLWDAARIDGAGHLLFLFRIVVPISRAAITTVVLFSFIGSWDMLEWPLLVTTSENWRPIAYALYDFRNVEGNDPQLLMAGAMITLLPIIIVYLIAQKQFTEGIATTGLKG